MFEMEVVTSTDLELSFYSASMGKSQRTEKLSYSRRNLEKMAGKIRPLCPGNI
jgi:hypothetical protein